MKTPGAISYAGLKLLSKNTARILDIHCLMIGFRWINSAHSPFQTPGQFTLQPQNTLFLMKTYKHII